RVRPEWVDHYGHMNMGFYLVVFDMATDQLWPRLGLGPGLHARGFGTFAAETWVNYVREVREGMPLACTNQVLAFDAKRLICLHRMYHATEGWLAAENEVLYLCMDLAVRKVGLWPADILAGFDAARSGDGPLRLSLQRRQPLSG
ncbi:MAG: thioesterase, partial [Belnapia sp.]|nr:thioesterase [Belnapia sp.]